MGALDTNFSIYRLSSFLFSCRVQPAFLVARFLINRVVGALYCILVQQYPEYIGMFDGDDAPRFQLATLPGLRVNHIPKGNLVYFVHERCSPAAWTAADRRLA